MDFICSVAQASYDDARSVPEGAGGGGFLGIPLLLVLFLFVVTFISIIIQFFIAIAGIGACVLIYKTFGYKTSLNILLITLVIFTVIVTVKKIKEEMEGEKKKKELEKNLIPWTDEQREFYRKERDRYDLWLAVRAGRSFY